MQIFSHTPSMTEAKWSPGALKCSFFGTPMVFCEPRHSSCFGCSQGLFGDDHNKNGFQMFDSSKYHSQDLLFKDATVRAVPVREKTTYLDWLGPDYVVALEGMLSQQCSGAGRAAGLRCQHL